MDSNTFFSFPLTCLVSSFNKFANRYWFEKKQIFTIPLKSDSVLVFLADKKHRKTNEYNGEPTEREIVRRDLSGLASARYILKRITIGDSIQTLIEDFDNDRRFVSTIVSFLEDVEWLKQELNGTYTITKKVNTDRQQFRI